jgi:hypothetical protein
MPTKGSSQKQMMKTPFCSVLNNWMIWDLRTLSKINLSNVRPSYDPYKSDLFSLGLVAIEMATLQDLAPIYDME